jgi:type VI protein secretion system component VasK
MFSFLRSYWKPLAMALVVMALAIAYFYVKSLRAENARLAEETSRNRAAIAQMAADIKANQRALELRRAESEVLARQRQEAVKSLEAIYEKDGEACEWSAGLIPDAVYESLCQ